MDTLTIDLTGQPPSMEDLAASRQAANDQLAAAQARKRGFDQFCMGMAAADIVAMTVAAWLDMVPWTATAAVAMITVVFMVYGMMVITAGVSTSITALFIVASLSVTPELATAPAIEVMGLGAITISALLTMVIALAIQDSRIASARNGAGKALQNLMYLDATCHPIQCIEFMKWVDADATVRAYQQQLAGMGRMPVMAEYEAAEHRIKSSGDRCSQAEVTEQARAACARMLASPQPPTAQ